MRRTILFFLLMLAVRGSAQEKMLTEESFLAIVKKFHPVARQAALDVSIAKAELLASRGKFDPALSTSLSRKDYDGAFYYNQRISELKIPTWYGVDLYAGVENISGKYVNPEKTTGQVSYLGFSVPLLQNLLMDKRRAVLLQARLYREQSETLQKATLNNLLLDAAKAYWDWWGNYRSKQQVALALQFAEKRKAMVTNFFLQGDRPAIDTVEALTQVQGFALRLSEAELALQQSAMELNNYLWKEGDVPYELPADAIPQPMAEKENLRLDSLLAAVEKHPELSVYQFKLGMLQIEKKLKLQSLLPEATLKYNQLVGGNNPAKSVHSAWFQNNYRYGFAFSLPLRLSEGRSEYRKAGLKLDQTRLEQLNKQVQLRTKLKQAFMEWQQLSVQLELQQQITLNYASLQRGEELRFMNGESSLFLINARELKTLEGRQKQVELEAKYRQSLSKLKWAAGVLGKE